MTTDERLDKIIELLSRLTPSLQIQVCPKNYSGDRAHKWNWRGTTYQNIHNYQFAPGNKPRHGIYQECGFCDAENWSVGAQAEEAAGLPLFKTGDKVILSVKAHTFENETFPAYEADAEVDQAFLSAGGGALVWQYGLTYQHPDGHKVDRTASADELTPCSVVA